MTTPRVFLLSFVCQNEMPDREGVLLATAPYATFAGAQKAAQNNADEIASYPDTEGEEPKTPTPLIWARRPYPPPPHGATRAWSAEGAGHVFLIREFPLED